MAIFSEVVPVDIAAIVAAVVAALGGMQGVRTIVKRVGRLVEIAEELETKSKKLDDVCGAIEKHSVRLADLERGVRVIGEIDMKLERQDASLLTMIESLDYGAWVSDDHGLCIFCNQTLAVLMMCPKDAIIGQSWKDAIHPDDRENVVHRWMDFVRGERSVFQANYRFFNVVTGQVNLVAGSALRPMVKGQKTDRIFGWAKLIKTTQSQVPMP